MFRQLLYPLLPYRSFFAPFLLLTLVIVPCWMLFRIYRLRSTGRRPSLWREIVLLGFIVYLAGLGMATLSPNRASRVEPEPVARIDPYPSLTSLTCSTGSVPAGSTARSFCVRNARGNVALFFPLGILIPLVWTHVGFLRALMFAIGTSIGIEVAQYLSSGWGNRLADVNDVILNGVGALLGLAVVFLIRSRTGAPARGAPA